MHEKTDTLAMSVDMVPDTGNGGGHDDDDDK